MYKGILLDIDNTLYQYNPLHDLATTALFDHIHDNYNASLDEIKIGFDTAKLHVKQNTPETAASHNRLLYVQNMCEIIGIDSLKHSLELYNVYLGYFFSRFSSNPWSKTIF